MAYTSDNALKEQAEMRADFKKVCLATAESIRKRARTWNFSPGTSSTGATLESLYIVTAEGSDYRERVNAALLLRGVKASAIMPEENLPHDFPDYEAIVCIPFNYSKIVHDGYDGLRVIDGTKKVISIPGQPFLDWATAIEKPYHDQRIAAVLRKWGF